MGGPVRSGPSLLASVTGVNLSVLAIVICGDPQAKDTKALLQCVHSIYIPNKVWSLSPAPLSASPHFPQLPSISGSSEGLEKKPTQWVLLVSGWPRVTLSAASLSQVLILLMGTPRALSCQLPFLEYPSADRRPGHRLCV